MNSPILFCGRALLFFFLDTRYTSYSSSWWVLQVSLFRRSRNPFYHDTLSAFFGGHGSLLSFVATIFLGGVTDFVRYPWVSPGFLKIFRISFLSNKISNRIFMVRPRYVFC